MFSWFKLDLHCYKIKNKSKSRVFKNVVHCHWVEIIPIDLFSVLIIDYAVTEMNYLQVSTKI